MAAVLDSRDVRSIDLSQPHNISHWLSSMLLGIGSLVAMLVYSLRRHRVDDYHGRYRVWLWAAVGCLAASLAESSDVIQLVHGVCRKLAELCSVADAVLWPASVGAVLAAVAIRLFFEVRRCRLATVALVASVGCFLTAAAVDHDLFLEFTSENRPLVQRGSWLIGYVLVLTTFLCYTRHVLLEIDGVVALVPAKARRRKVKSASSTKPETSSNETVAKPALHVRSDLEEVEKPASATPAASLRMGTPPVSSASPTTQMHQSNSRALSRTERRRMRRETRMAG